MKVLVTGSSGWLGRHLMPLIQDAKYDAIGLDVVPGQFTHAVGSVADKDFILALFEEYDFDSVVHAAALHKPDITRYSKQAFINVNIAGTLNLLDAVSRKKNTRFIFTSTTSLMISRKIREERSPDAVWLDEESGPLEPRNIYGVTKLAAEGLCRLYHLDQGLSTIILRTARFFPEEDDTIQDIPGLNLKANELLYRRATVTDMARAHLAALEKADEIKYGLYIVSAPTPFERSDTIELRANAKSVITRKFPDAEVLYENLGWHLPTSVGRVYDGSRIARELGFKYKTEFSDVLLALREDRALPIVHDAGYVSPAWLLQQK